MSLLSVAPELVSVAASDLSGIGSAISEANALASGATLGVVAPAADSVSAELAALFGGHAQTYQTVSSRAEVFHQEFVSTLARSSAAYAQAEADSAAGLGRGRAGGGLQVLGARQHRLAEGAGSRLWRPEPSRLWRPGMADPRLVTPRHSLPAGARLWHPGLPGFKAHNGFAPRLFTPHNELLGGVLNGSRGIVQNIGQLIEQIIKNQIGYLKLIGTSLVDFVKDELNAILGLPDAFVQSVKDLLHGNIKDAMNDVLKGCGHLFITSLQSHVANGAYWYTWQGALPALWHVMQIPADEMQNLADLLKPLGLGVTGKLVQNLLANPLELLASGWQMRFNFDWSFEMNPLLLWKLDLLGAPIVSLEAFENGVQGAFDALTSGHVVKGIADILETPFNVSKALLFGQDYIELPPITKHDGSRPSSNDFYVHLGGLFAPGDYVVNNYTSGGVTRWIPYTNGPQTGGLIPALVSTLPPKLQDPFHELRRILDGIAAKLMGFPALNY